MSGGEEYNKNHYNERIEYDDRRTSPTSYLISPLAARGKNSGAIKERQEH